MGPLTGPHFGDYSAEIHSLVFEDTTYSIFNYIENR